MFNHGSVRLPERVDRQLRLLLVTPDMHRVLHSIVRQETDSNFGFSVSWDLCGGCRVTGIPTATLLPIVNT